MGDIAELILNESIVVTSETANLEVTIDVDSQLVAELGATGNAEAFIPDGKPTIVQISGGEALSAKVLIIEKIARHNFSALRMMVLPTATECEYGQPTSYATAKVAGMSVNAGITGSICKILLFGQHQDPFFTFAAQIPLFLGVDGLITDTPPTPLTATHQVTIGQSLGLGSIHISISEPVAI